MTHLSVNELGALVVIDNGRARTWRPLVAVLDTDLEDRTGQRVFMTRDQFENWMHEQNILRRRRKDPISPCAAVGIGDHARRMLLHGHRTASRCEALAMAHYARRMELPIDCRDHQAFNDFVMRNFGAVNSISAWLGVDDATMREQMAGYRINRDRQRMPTQVSVTIVRALDWVLKVGAFCPYGEPRKSRTFTTGEASS